MVPPGAIRVSGRRAFHLGRRSRDTAVWNERMAKLLPSRWDCRYRVGLAGQHAGEIVDDRPANACAHPTQAIPCWPVFPSRRGSGLRALFNTCCSTRARESRAQRDLALREWRPALVEKQVGKGRVMLLSTTVDREWTDLPIRTGFLPLVREAARRLVG